MAILRGACVGAGYFSKFHYDAWSRIPEVEIVAVCDMHSEKADLVRRQYGIEKGFADLGEMLSEEQPDFLDVITPPETHLTICRTAAELGIHVVCQKPFAPSLDEAEQIVRCADEKGVRLMVHDNWRFQPWYREIRRLLDSAVVGDRLHSLNCRCRMGDGWGSDAYLDRQPYFRDYPRLFIYETGVHFIDTFRYLAGEIRRVYAVLTQLNPVIKGEDSALVIFDLESSGLAILDANRYNEANYANPRYTFGEVLIDLDGGSIRLFGDGRITVQKLGGDEEVHDYFHSNRGFAGDCCFAALSHFTHRMLDGEPFETHGLDYLRTLAVQEAVYESAEKSQPVEVRY